MLCNMAELLTTAEVAQLMGVNRSTITRRVQSGDLCPVFAREGKGGVYLFDPATLDLDLDEPP